MLILMVVNWTQPTSELSVQLNCLKFFNCTHAGRMIEVESCNNHASSTLYRYEAVRSEAYTCGCCEQRGVLYIVYMNNDAVRNEIWKNIKINTNSQITAKGFFQILQTENRNMYSVLELVHNCIHSLFLPVKFTEVEKKI